MGYKWDSWNIIEIQLGCKWDLMEYQRDSMGCKWDINRRATGIFWKDNIIGAAWELASPYEKHSEWPIEIDEHYDDIPNLAMVIFSTLPYAIYAMFNNQRVEFWCVFHGFYGWSTTRIRNPCDLTKKYEQHDCPTELDTISDNQNQQGVRIFYPFLSHISAGFV